ncbi:MAG TPA: helix-turn-helix domain-containing protein [Candidatus Bathyarchaeia archaeon]|nr:helix-turn-helix domain-containing protein [Candidatus Bathyarchaeia archaeon]
MFPFPRQTLLVAEPLFIFTVFFIFLTMASTLLYYKRVRQASKAYEEAKNTVSDIVISFDKQLSRQEEEVGVAMQKIEVQAARGEKLSRRLDEQEDRITTGLGELSSKVQTLPEVESVKTVLSGLTEKVEGLARAQEEWKKRAISVTESQIEAAIPLKREQALAPLTDTELRVLEFIATSPSGERTAPEVQEIIRLTREHTARLMKKLYEGGYLERRDAKTPYAYRVKEEMLRMLKKSEAKA